MRGDGKIERLTRIRIRNIVRRVCKKKIFVLLYVFIYPYVFFYFFYINFSREKKLSWNRRNKIGMYMDGKSKGL